jgi:hypothetical protein
MMTMHELHNIWYDGNRNDPTFMLMYKNMLDFVSVITPEDIMLYQVMRDDIKYNMEDWLYLQ